MDFAFKEQSDSIDNQFDKIDAHFDRIDARFDDLQAFILENFATKDYFDKKFDELPTKEDFQKIVTAMDNYAKLVNNHLRPL